QRAVRPVCGAPLAIASLMMPTAARSFTEAPGFMNSALPRMVQPVSSEARRSLMRVVRPTAAATLERGFKLNSPGEKARNLAVRLGARNGTPARRFALADA